MKKRTILVVLLLLSLVGAGAYALNTTLGGTMRNNQEWAVTLNPKNGSGQAVAGGTIVWSSDNPALVNLVPSADTYSCVIKAKDGPGRVTITAQDSKGTSPPSGVTQQFVLDITDASITDLNMSLGTGPRPLTP